MRRSIWHLEYEGIHLVCFKYGIYGYRDDFCPQHKTEAKVDGVPAEEADSGKEAPLARLEVTEEYGP